jgi:hypothetical protein
MALTRKLPTTKFGVSVANQFADSFAPGGDMYYMYFAKHVPYGTNFAYQDVNTVALFNGKTDVSANNITIADNPFNIGDRVKYYTDTNITAINGLVNNSIYYVRSKEGDAIQLGANSTATVSVGIVAKPNVETHYFTYASGSALKPSVGDDVENPLDSDQYTSVQAYDDMVFAKRIRQEDIRLMVPKYLWTQGTVYSQYENTDPNLHSVPFFVVVDDLTEFNVFKCLFNNNGAASIDPPSRNGNSLDYYPVETSDKYLWQYMYTITKLDYERFSTSQYIPVTANTMIVENAVPGTIEVIKVATGGTGYANWYTGTFESPDIRYLGSGTLYGLGDDASPINEFYQGGVLKITESQTPGIVGQYQIITSSVGVGAKKFVSLQGSFSATPSAGDRYEIYPLVSIWGDGNETTKAFARAIINPNAANSVSRVEMLNTGRLYRNAIANIEIPEVVKSSTNYKPAILEPIVSPPQGHGGNPAVELGAKQVGISVSVSDTENGTIPATNDFRSVGILKNPLFNNVTLTHNTPLGTFSVGETVVQYKDVRLYGSIETTAGRTIAFKTGNGQISSNVLIVSAGSGYDHRINPNLDFNNVDTGGSEASGTFTANVEPVVEVEFPGSNTVSNNYVDVGLNPFANGDKVQYYTDLTSDGIDGLSNNEYYYVVSSNASHLRLSGNNSPTNYKLIANSGGSGNTFLAVINGAILTTTVTNQGSGYDVSPVVTINVDAGGSGGLLVSSLSNPEITSYMDSFEAGDTALITSGTRNFVSKVSRVSNDFQIIMETPATFSSANNIISRVEPTAIGEVYSVSTGQIGIRNVSGIFQSGSKILGLTSYASATIKDENAIKINDKSPLGFNTVLQLTTLVGNLEEGFIPFIEDEKLYQDSLVPYAQPSGRVHSIISNAGANNDVVYISREYGIFNTDPAGIRDIYGDTSESGFRLQNIYKGDLVKGSGEVLYIENVDPINRGTNKSEIIKIILEF